VHTVAGGFASGEGGGKVKKKKESFIKPTPGPGKEERRRKCTIEREGEKGEPGERLFG